MRTCRELGTQEVLVAARLDALENNVVRTPRKVCENALERTAFPVAQRIIVGLILRLKRCCFSLSLSLLSLPP